MGLFALKRGSIVENNIALSETQLKVMRRFYAKPIRKIALNKKERKVIWDNFKTNKNLKNYSHIKELVPALYAELEKSVNSGKNVQSAVFSECVYAQDLAIKFDLSKFVSHTEKPILNAEKILDKSTNYENFSIRYKYSNAIDSEVLLQAGGHGSVDCAFESKVDDFLAMIEMKEPYARTSEPDLPKYGEDGLLVTTSEFEATYPQFSLMLKEHIDKGLNLLGHIGKNVNDFSIESLQKAVLENYSGEKFADVICTEDSFGFLVMIPSNHVSRWAKLEGEIRPSGRNSYSVWTDQKLIETLNSVGAELQENQVQIKKSRLIPAKERGGTKISRFKISPLFFVRLEDIVIKGETCQFVLDSVKQLNPSISAKMKFVKLNVNNVINFYQDQL